jgi:hypothetical protein
VPQVDSREERAESREQRGEGSEQRAESGEQRVDGRSAKSVIHNLDSAFAQCLK